MRKIFEYIKEIWELRKDEPGLYSGELIPWFIIILILIGFFGILDVIVNGG
jgi:hypothetical protein